MLPQSIFQLAASMWQSETIGDGFYSTISEISESIDNNNVSDFFGCHALNKHIATELQKEDPKQVAARPGEFR